MSSVVSIDIDAVRNAAGSFHQGADQLEQQRAAAQRSGEALLSSFRDGHGRARDEFEEELRALITRASNLVERLTDLSKALEHEAEEFAQADASF